MKTLLHNNVLALVTLLNPVTSGMAVEHEIYEAWHEWIGDLAKITSTVDQINSLLQQCERDREELEYLADRREKICGKRKTGAGDDPPAPSPAKSTPPQKQPQTANDPQSTTSPPAQPSSSCGFMMPKECGCSSSRHRNRKRTQSPRHRMSSRNRNEHRAYQASIKHHSIRQGMCRFL